MTAHPDLDARARDIIDHNRYMTLGTLDPTGEPRLSPVHFTDVDYSDFYWVSSPSAHHSANVARHAAVSIVIYDSSASVGEGQAVFVQADAAEVPDAELAERCSAAFSGDLRGAVAFTPDDLRGDARLRLYRAAATAYEVHVRGRDPSTATASTGGCPPTHATPSGEDGCARHRRAVALLRRLVEPLERRCHGPTRSITARRGRDRERRGMGKTRTADFATRPPTRAPPSAVIVVRLW
jgi:hypothetical protein